jgi:uncharacterized protein YjbJ (UPF0337 family)
VVPPVTESDGHDRGSAFRETAERALIGASPDGGTGRDQGGNMGFADRAQHEFEELKGKVKEKVGDATDNERLQAEGIAEQSEANAKQAGDHAKDAAHDAKDALR